MRRLKVPSKISFNSRGKLLYLEKITYVNALLYKEDLCGGGEMNPRSLVVILFISLRFDLFRQVGRGFSNNNFVKQTQSLQLSPAVHVQPFQIPELIGHMIIPPESVNKSDT